MPQGVASWRMPVVKPWAIPPATPACYGGMAACLQTQILVMGRESLAAVVTAAVAPTARCLRCHWEGHQAQSCKRSCSLDSSAPCCVVPWLYGGGSPSSTGGYLPSGVPPVPHSVVQVASLVRVEEEGRQEGTTPAPHRPLPRRAPLLTICYPLPSRHHQLH
jgi:hypothetical protein